MGLWEQIRHKFYAGGGTGPFFSQWTLPGSTMSKRDQLAAYKGYVYVCVAVIAEHVAKAEIFVENTSGREHTRLDNHEAKKLLDRPNPMQSGFMLRELTQTHIELAGEAFWYFPVGDKTRTPKEIYILRPDLVDVVVNTDGTIKGYVLKRENSNEKIPLDVDEVLHFKMPNPLNPYRGLSTVEAAMVYVQTEDFASKWTRNFMFNDARPAGIVSFKGTIRDEEFEKVKRQWKDKYGGVNNAGKTAFVRGTDVTFTKFGLSLDEIALRDLKEMTRDDIMAMFRVSKPLLGIVDDVNLANGKNAKRIFLENVIEPKVERFVDTLNAFLIQRFGRTGTNHQFAYDNVVPDDLTEEGNYHKMAVNAWETINEARAKFSLKPIAGGDVLYMPMNNVALGSPAPAPAGKGVKAKAAPETKNISDPTVKEIYRKDMIERSRSWERKFVSDFRLFLDEASRKNQEQIKSIGRKKEFDGMVPTPEDLLDMSEDRIVPLLLELALDQGQNAMDLLGEEFSFEISDALRRDVTERVGKFMEGFSETLINKLTESLSEGLTAGEGLSDLRKRVAGVYEAAKGFETERIARTETLYMSNKSALEAYSQSGVVEQLEWFTNPGACEFCASMQGKVVGLNQPFAGLGETVIGDNGGQFIVNFEAVDAPPLHPNCECAVLPVVVQTRTIDATRLISKAVKREVAIAKAEIEDSLADQIDSILEEQS